MKEVEDMATENEEFKSLWTDLIKLKTKSGGKGKVPAKNRAFAAVRKCVIKDKKPEKQIVSHD